MHQISARGASVENAMNSENAERIEPTKGEAATRVDADADAAHAADDTDVAYAADAAADVAHAADDTDVAHAADDTDDTDDTDVTDVTDDADATDSVLETESDAAESTRILKQHPLRAR